MWVKNGWLCVFACDGIKLYFVLPAFQCFPFNWLTVCVLYVETSIEVKFQFQFRFFSLGTFRAYAKTPVLNNNDGVHNVNKYLKQSKWSKWHNMLNSFEMNHFVWLRAKVQIPCNSVYYATKVLHHLQSNITSISISHAYIIWCGFIHSAIFVNRIFPNCHFSNS